MVGTIGGGAHSAQNASKLFQKVGNYQNPSGAKLGKTNTAQDRIAEIKTRIEEIRSSEEMSSEEKSALVQSMEQEIAALQKQSLEENVEETGEVAKKEGGSNQKITKEEVQGRRNKDLLELSDDYKKLKDNFAVTAQVKGNADVLKAELGGLNPGNVEAKTEKIADLSSRVNGSMNMIGSKMNKIMDKAAEVREDVVDKSELEDSKGKNDEEDLSVVEKNMEFIQKNLEKEE